ncbi:hypothetical protein CVT26_006519 [Gymnopilus dilepis]|uniref:Uncharacterized protein n=1 Tax=Gymnopilus dilepis TaxID=231916 RepID=A0A409Y3F5_9AGAR|nr:hypothetical protein CVT26_006519 [Gymnopilus dilepis]
MSKLASQTRGTTTTDSPPEGEETADNARGGVVYPPKRRPPHHPWLQGEMVASERLARMFTLPKRVGEVGVIA